MRAQRQPVPPASHAECAVCSHVRPRARVEPVCHDCLAKLLDTARLIVAQPGPGQRQAADGDEWVSPAMAAGVLHVHRRTVLQYAKSGRLPARLLPNGATAPAGRRWRVSMRAVRALLEGEGGHPRPLQRPGDSEGPAS